MNRKNKIRMPFGDRVFIGIDSVLMFAFFIIILYPLLYVIASSVSGGSHALPLTLIPQKFTLASYQALLDYTEIWTGYWNSLIYMVLGTTIALFVTICAAYPLSVKGWKGAVVLVPMCVVTMYIGGGLIPTYLTISSLGMINTVWAVTIPGALSIHNMIVMRTFFATQIPGELRESAMLDGCGNIRYLVSIVLPLSGAIIAVIGLYYAVGIWNSYFDAMIYLKRRELYPLTLFTREILIQNNTSNMENMGVDLAGADELEARKNLLKYSVIVVSSLPLMLAYPFVQKYFVKGVMIGAVKG